MGTERGEDQMRKSAFTEEQIAYALRQAESGTPVLEVCRKLGISEQTFYRWKKKFAGMGVAELRRLRQLEEENRQLKQLVADLTLDRHMLQEVIRKNLSGRPSNGSVSIFCGSAFMSANGVRVGWLGCGARVTATAVRRKTRQRCGCAFAS